MASVIYLTDTRFGQRAWEHPSARHRCYHFSDALISSGQASRVLPLERVNAKMLDQFDHAIFHRPSYNKRFMRALECCRKATVTVHADYDDLVFLPQIAQHSPLYLTGSRSLDKVVNQFQKTHQAAQCFESFILSTTFLRDKLLETFADVTVSVVPNALPRLFSRPVSLASDTAPLTIGYFPGSHGHGEDFKLVKSALSRIINKNTRLLVAGKLDQQYLSGLSNVTSIPFANYNRYLQMLASVDVSIAPLGDNIFNRAKSAVKLIESVSVGTPIVASANGDMTDHSNSMAQLLVQNDDWYQTLSDVLANARQAKSQHHKVADELSRRYSVRSRMPVLQEHLQCAA